MWEEFLITGKVFRVCNFFPIMALLSATADEVFLPSDSKSRDCLYVLYARHIYFLFFEFCNNFISHARNEKEEAQRD